MDPGFASLLLIGIIGVLVGAVGIGGFLLVPCLVLTAGVSVRGAVVVATLSFLVAGFVSLCAMHRERAERAPGIGAFLVFAAPGALIGALLVGVTAERLLGGFIAVAFAAAGVCEWIGLPRSRGGGRLRVIAGSIGGSATGLTSTLTGTSGPMAAIPILALLGVEVHRRVRIAQVAQIPIGVAALLTYATLADVPWKLAAQSAVALGLGTIIGIRAARHIPSGRLRRASAVLMLPASAYMATTAFQAGPYDQSRRGPSSATRLSAGTLALPVREPPATIRPRAEPPCCLDVTNSRRERGPQVTKAGSGVHRLFKPPFFARRLGIAAATVSLVQRMVNGSPSHGDALNSRSLDDFTNAQSQRIASFARHLSATRERRPSDLVDPVAEPLLCSPFKPLGSAQTAASGRVAAPAWVDPDARVPCADPRRSAPRHAG